MTVYVKQPEINVREKLNELGINSSLPLDKMPSGSIVQVQHATFFTRSTTNSTSFVESDIELYVTPKYESSEIFIHVSTSGNNNNTVGHDLFYTIFRTKDFNETDNVDVNLGNSTYGMGGLRTNQAASGTNNRLEAPIVIGAVDKPRSIERLKYVVRFRSESSSSVVEMPMLVGQNSLILAMEIRR